MPLEIQSITSFPHTQTLMRTKKQVQNIIPKSKNHFSMRNNYDDLSHKNQSKYGTLHHKNRLGNQTKSNLMKHTNQITVTISK